MQIDLQVNSQDGILVRDAAVRMLGKLAESSILNCGKIASMSAGPALAHALATTSQGEGRLCQNVTHAMAILARDSPLR